MLKNNHPLEVYKNVFGKFGRIHIPNFLPPAIADELASELQLISDWRLKIKGKVDGEELSLKDWGLLTDQSKFDLNTALINDARNGFQYRYLTKNLQPSENGLLIDESLKSVSSFVFSSDFCDSLKVISSCEKEARVDCQATRYDTGCFLTRHNDFMAHKDRVAAYVINLSRDWKAEFGGVLEFIDKDGHISEGYVPAFNSINIFKVPQVHQVSYVNEISRGSRLSLTGWLIG